MDMRGLMNRYSNDDPLRRYYVRQLKKTGYRGNAGGWVFTPKGTRCQGWAPLLDLLASSMDAFGRALRTEAK